MIRLLRKICTFLGDRADVNSGDVWNVYTFSVIQHQFAGHDVSSRDWEDRICSTNDNTAESERI